MRYTEHISHFALGISTSQFSDFPYDICCEFSSTVPIVTTGCSTVSFTIGHIICHGTVFEIVQSWIGVITILVARDDPWSTGANKGFSYQDMYSTCKFGAFKLRGNANMSFGVRGLL